MKAKAKKPKKIKMKTKKTFAKRVKETGSGKLKRSHNYISHFAANKTHKQKKHLSKPTTVSASDMKRDKQLLQG
ncbi:MAG: 50S ribosomal protein L35 [Solobacterium sp.]|nr:50S ribosomal protein L35 [Solobacterium sp.]MBR2669891.1 50S ribosomal protein L35 [Solobacterium sp.]